MASTYTRYMRRYPFITCLQTICGSPKTPSILTNLTNQPCQSAFTFPRFRTSSSQQPNLRRASTLAPAPFVRIVSGALGGKVHSGKERRESLELWLVDWFKAPFCPFASSQPSQPLSSHDPWKTQVAGASWGESFWVGKKNRKGFSVRNKMHLSAQVAAPLASGWRDDWP